MTRRHLDAFLPQWADTADRQEVALRELLDDLRPATEDPARVEALLRAFEANWPEARLRLTWAEATAADPRADTPLDEGEARLAGRTWRITWWTQR